MRLSLRQFDEVVAVTGHHEATVFMRELQDDRIGGFLREHVAHAQDFVTELLEQVGEILGYVVVEQELHR